MTLFLQLLLSLSVILFFLLKAHRTARNIAAGLCLASCVGLLVVSLLPESLPPGALERETRTGELISRAILEVHDGGEVLLVTWPLIGQRWENLANHLEQGLQKELGKNFALRRFPVEEWSDLDPPLGVSESPPPAKSWAALAERLPDCTILVSMVGHPDQPIRGLYTRCESLFLTDPYNTLPPDAVQVDSRAPLRAFVQHRSIESGETIADAVELVTVP